VRTFHLEPEFFVQGDTDGVSKHETPPIRFRALIDGVSAERLELARA
jgi:hypothetical protein